MPASDVSANTIGTSATIAERADPLRLVHVVCCVCGSDDPAPVAVGRDFEDGTRGDTYLMVRCRVCSLLYLNPRPADGERERLAPLRSHAKSALERRRPAPWCRDVAPNARVLSVGYSDGLHLERVGTLGFEPETFDLIVMVHVIERVADAAATLAYLRTLLRPGARLVVVTDNAESPGRRLFGDRHWGGYRFPQHLNLFTRATLGRLAQRCGLHVAKLETRRSSLNWMYSIRNVLLDARAPAWLVARFGSAATGASAVFSLFDATQCVSGHGALLCATLRRPLV